jgi:predicted AlkP superfamily pyrophosphatase or phosphodiesterase
MHAFRSHLLKIATASVLAVLAIGRVATQAPDTIPHVVVISIDGLRPDTYTVPGVADVPTLRQLAAGGAYARGVIGVFPSVTYPSHTTIVTGLKPADHGIYNNRILDPENRSGGAWYWYARTLAAPTLIGAVRARGLRSAAVNWPVTVGSDVDFLVPEFTVSAHRESLSLLAALSRPNTLLDDVQEARGQPMEWPMTDAARAEIAAWIIKTHRPHLLLLHITDTDTTQHDYGPGSPEARAAIASADRNVRTVLSAVDAAGLGLQTDVVIVSDHGFLRLERQLQMNALFKQEGWLEVDGQGRVKRWEVYFQSSGGSGFVFLKDPADAALRQRVSDVLARLANDPANGIERVLSAEELRRLGADPRASFAIDMRAGYYTGNANDRLLAPAGSKGGHGYDPTRPDLHASLIMSGPHVPKVGDLGIVRMTRIGPTIAGWFGVALSPKADEPLEVPAHP